MDIEEKNAQKHQPFAKILGANIRKQRALSRLSQDELGRLIGKDFTSVSKYESGDRMPEDRVLVAIARIFKCDTHTLLLEDPSIPDPADTVEG